MNWRASASLRAKKIGVYVRQSGAGIVSEAGQIAAVYERTGYFTGVTGMKLCLAYKMSSGTFGGFNFLEKAYIFYAYCLNRQKNAG